MSLSGFWEGMSGSFSFINGLIRGKKQQAIWAGFVQVSNEQNNLTIKQTEELTVTPYMRIGDRQGSKSTQQNNREQEV